MADNMKLSIIIPCFNEEERLAKSLPIIKNYMKSIGIFNYEIIISDDGSTDSTRLVAKRHNCVLTPVEKNKGKWYAIRRAIMISTATDYILITDSDLSTPISYFAEFIKDFPKYDVVIASRAIDGSNVKTSLFKKIAGRISNIPISFIVKDIKDTQTGFKMFSVDVAKKIFPKCIINRWGGDVEVLYLTQKYGYKIKEYPVNWTNMPGSKVKLSDYPTTLLELLKIWWHKYD